jgi:pimeloyl-ACP methyl ester carboxylesterase
MPTKTPPDPASELIRDHVRSLPKRFRHGSADGLVAEWELHVGAQVFAISVADRVCSVREGTAAAPQAVVAAEPAVWLAMDEGRLTGGQAFFDQALAVRGNLDLAVRFQTLFRPYKRARRAADLEQVEIEAGGTKLSCYVVGEGPPLLLLHGLGAFKVTWVPVLSELARDHRVIVPDLPGHGESQKPSAEYAPRYFAHVMRCLLDEMRIERAVVIGNSLGGRVALELALHSPGRVAAMALLDPALPGLRWRYIVGLTKVLPTEFGAFPVPLRERWMELAIRRLFARPDRMPPEVYAVAAREFVRIYRQPAARVAFFSALRHLVTERPEPFFAALRRIRQPALVIFGEQDRLVPPRLGVRLVQHVRDARLVVLPDVGHVPQVEAMEETLAELRGFLASSPAGESRA